ncbi:MAG TPA: hypothetical protein VHE12_03055 [bacterium]|nr:hypothetical protein [bacterium]
MRWRIRGWRAPRVGDYRIQRSFAWFPVPVGGFQVWFERYYSVQRCWYIYEGLLGAEWTREFLSLELRPALDYLKAQHGDLTYMRSQNLYRNMAGTER